jgi:hypothetical protein
LEPFIVLFARFLANTAITDLIYFADQVRQMAGVYLRKKLLSHWKKLDAEARHAIKIGALETLVQEQE